MLNRISNLASSAWSLCTAQNSIAITSLAVSVYLGRRCWAAETAQSTLLQRADTTDRSQRKITRLEAKIGLLEKSLATFEKSVAEANKLYSACYDREQALKLVVREAKAARAEALGERDAKDQELVEARGQVAELSGTVAAAERRLLDAKRDLEAKTERLTSLQAELEVARAHASPPGPSIPVRFLGDGFPSSVIALLAREHGIDLQPYNPDQLPPAPFVALNTGYLDAVGGRFPREPAIPDIKDGQRITGGNVITMLFLSKAALSVVPPGESHKQSKEWSINSGVCLGESGEFQTRLACPAGKAQGGELTVKSADAQQLARRIATLVRHVEAEQLAVAEGESVPA